MRHKINEKNEIAGKKIIVSEDWLAMRLIQITIQRQQCKGNDSCTSDCSSELLQLLFLTEVPAVVDIDLTVCTNSKSWFTHRT